MAGLPAERTRKESSSLPAGRLPERPGRARSRRLEVIAVGGDDRCLCRGACSGTAVVQGCRWRGAEKRHHRQRRDAFSRQRQSEQDNGTSTRKPERPSRTKSRHLAREYRLSLPPEERSSSQITETLANGRQLVLAGALGGQNPADMHGYSRLERKVAATTPLAPGHGGKHRQPATAMRRSRDSGPALRARYRQAIRFRHADVGGGAQPESGETITTAEAMATQRRDGCVGHVASAEGGRRRR